MELTTIDYNTLAFDENGFWDSEQFEEMLPIQFWRDDVPGQLHLDVLLKAWTDTDVIYTLILGDANNFDSLTKHVLHLGRTWLVQISGNMAVDEIRVLK